MSTFNGQVAEKYIGESHKYSYTCAACSVTWHDRTTQSNCWTCGTQKNIKMSLNDVREQMAKDYQLSYEEVRELPQFDEEERRR